MTGGSIIPIYFFLVPLSNQKSYQQIQSILKILGIDANSITTEILDIGLVQIFFSM